MNGLSEERKSQILSLINSLSKNTDNHIDVVNLAITNGFKVLQLKSNASIDGLLLVSDVNNSITGEKIIAYRSDMEEKDNRFIIAHELGHYFLHSNNPAFLNRGSFVYAYHINNSAKNEIEEVEADFFATNLLVPKETFVSKYNELGKVAQSDFGIETLSNYFNVSKRCIIKRMSEIYG